MIFWVYMLHCRGGAYYTGHTNDLEHRVAQHQIGAIPGFTADRLPVELVWTQEFSSRLEALAAERQIKGWSRAKKMALIRGDWDAVSALAKKKDGPSTSSGRTGEGRAVIPRMVRPELVEGLSLVCHADTPCRAVRSITVSIDTHPKAASRFHFFVSGDIEAIVIPPPTSPGFADELWKTTCFEVFSKGYTNDWYDEFNLSPSGEWAAYSFGGYRSGMSVVRTTPPGIRTSWSIDRFELMASVATTNTPLPHQIALSAVIEEKDGTKSYWALRHPPGKPDFHHPDCFALTLEAPEAS